MKRVNSWRRRLTACLLVLIAGCGYRYQGKSEYEEAQELDQVFKKAVQTAGGSAELQTIKKYGQEGQAWAINLNKAQIGDVLIDAMVKLGQVAYIAKLDLGQSTITNKQLLKLDAVKACRLTMELDLSNTGLDDATLDQILNLNCLETVNLKGTKVTSQAISRFKAKRKSNEDVLPPFKNPKIAM